MGDREFAEKKIKRFDRLRPEGERCDYSLVDAKKGDASLTPGKVLL
jgi:hypothetical protein